MTTETLTAPALPSHLKKCSHCAEVKSVEDFSTDKGSRDGLYSWCRRCDGERKRDRNARNPMHRWAQDYRKRARKGGWLVLEDHPNSVPSNYLAARQGGTCLARGCYEYLELELDHRIPVSWGGRHVLGNIQLLCREHHREKTNAEREYLRRNSEALPLLAVAHRHEWREAPSSEEASA
ncbi:HNH endonuclease signature motif containing protein [Brevibacterium samyangense]|uniref:HNH nuclease domain-containing protein n=1 Tax=Brevibacterium samyangense TaxID=366888 RepID=A0ABN2THA9_9MICO